MKVGGKNMLFIGLQEAAAMLANKPEKFAEYVRNQVVIIGSGHIRGNLEIYENNVFAMTVDPFIAYNIAGHIKFHSVFSDEWVGGKSYWESVARNKPRMHFIGQVRDYSYEEKTINIDLKEWYLGYELLTKYREWDFRAATDKLLDDIATISGNKRDISLDEQEGEIWEKELCALCERESKRHELVLQRYLEKTKLENAFKKDRHAVVQYDYPISGYDNHLKMMKKAMRLREFENVYLMLYGTVDTQGILFTTEGIVYRGREKGIFGKIDYGRISWDELAEEWYKNRNNGYELFYLVKSGEMSLFGKESDNLRFEINDNSYPDVLNQFVSIMAKALNGYYPDDFDILIPTIDDSF